MSDFDTVLERLLTDPVFQAALRADPDRALAPYQLAPDERALLDAQVETGSDGSDDRTVEMRVSKSGVFGLVGPVVSALGLAGGPAEARGQGAFGLAPRDQGTLDPGAPAQTFGAAEPTQVFGSVDVSGAPVEATDYHTSVDADGDGRWDAYTAYQRADGGVDIHVDSDGDGRVDFVGRDDDRDGLVDGADVDTDGDGVLDTRLHDDDGDGWMDRSTPIPAATPDVQTFGQAPRKP